MITHTYIISIPQSEPEKSSSPSLREEWCSKFWRYSTLHESDKNDLIFLRRVWCQWFVDNIQNMSCKPGRCSLDCSLQRPRFVHNFFSYVIPLQNTFILNECFSILQLSACPQRVIWVISAKRIAQDTLSQIIIQSVSKGQYITCSTSDRCSVHNAAAKKSESNRSFCSANVRTVSTAST